MKASLSIDCPFYMGPTHLSNDGAVIYPDPQTSHLAPEAPGGGGASDCRGVRVRNGVAEWPLVTVMTGWPGVSHQLVPWEAIPTTPVTRIVVPI